jgi:tRNA nucleotidyltransferase (CCA-adding enzyme)
MEQPAAVKLIIHRLQEAGFQAYAVGGCVRDALRGVTPQDWDICSSALPEELHRVLGDLHLIDTGLAHGTVTVRLEGQSYEVTTFRRDGSYSDHRRPDGVEFVPDLAQDLARRDFTINAMALSEAGEVIDLYGGREDLAAGILRCVGDPDQRFREDALRILRALRFGAVLNFRLEENTAQAARDCKDLLRCVSSERIYSELNKLLVGPGAAEILREYWDIFGVILPEILPCVGFPQHNPCHSEDVWSHTLTALALSAPDRLVRWVLLLHDLGKPAAHILGKDGYDHFPGHPVQSRALAEQILLRLHADKDTRQRVCWLVYVHDAWPPTTRGGLLRWRQKASWEDLRRLAEIRRCDGLAHTDHPKMLMVRQTTRDFAQLLGDEDVKNAPFQVSQLEISGKDLLELGETPGPRLGEALNALLEAVMDGECENRRETLLDYYKNHPLGGTS